MDQTTTDHFGQFGLDICLFILLLLLLFIDFN